MKNRLLHLFACSVLILAVFRVSPAEAQEPAPRIGRLAPPFVLGDLAGEDFRLLDLRGSVVLINFWAVRCSPCAEEMPSLNKLHMTFASEGFTVAAVSIDSSPELVRQFAAQHALSFPILLDRDQAIAFDDYAVVDLPKSFLIDRSGVIVEIYEGPRDWQSKEIQQRIRSLLTDPARGGSIQ